VILLNGGGDFGDTWEEAQAFRRQIIKEYPKNKIVVLPQTVFYSNKEKMLSDAAEFSRHNNLFLCARDERSYKTFKQYFPSNTVLLVPDMAFYIKRDTLIKYEQDQTNAVLFLKRLDKEINTVINYSESIHEKDVESSDWPTIEKTTLSYLLLRCLNRLCRLAPFVFSGLSNSFAFLIFKETMIRNGVKFISKYHKTYTTRLHGAILCCLLDRPFVLFDNSYEKNSIFFKTWLNDLEWAELKK
jgi:pyruvyl transferase EpsO